jgi:hypothetical protein
MLTHYLTDEGCRRILDTANPSPRPGFILLDVDRYLSNVHCDSEENFLSGFVTADLVFLLCHKDSGKRFYFASFERTLPVDIIESCEEPFTRELPHPLFCRWKTLAEWLKNELKMAEGQDLES